MTHMLVMLPPRPDMTDAERIAEGVYIPICKVPGATLAEKVIAYLKLLRVTDGGVISENSP